MKNPKNEYKGCVMVNLKISNWMELEKIFDPKDLVNFKFEKEPHITLVYGLHSLTSAMVLNNIQTLVLNSNHTFSENQMGILTNHEIGVHMVTTMNGLLHPLKIFSHGFPNNVETQEGLAVFSEYMSGHLTVKRLKELAYRVLAVDSLAKGYSFSKTFRLLHNTYDLNRESAFYITFIIYKRQITVFQHRINWNTYVT